MERCGVTEENVLALSSGSTRIEMGSRPDSTGRIFYFWVLQLPVLIDLWSHCEDGQKGNNNDVYQRICEVDSWTTPWYPSYKHRRHLEGREPLPAPKTKDKVSGIWGKL